MKKITILFLILTLSIGFLFMTSNYKVNASIVDLTGSKWYINSPELLALRHPEEDASEDWAIIFKSGNTTFNRLFIEYFESGYTHLQYHYGSNSILDICVLEGDDVIYIDDLYLNIEIISGSATTSPTLIALLESIATLQTPIQNYSVSFVSNGGTIYSDRYIDDRLTLLPIPERTNSRFTGWYYDKELSQQANNNDLITSNTTLYAGWILNTVYDNLTEIRYGEGVLKGFDDGYETGFNEGEGSAWSEAYEAGYRKALEVADDDIQTAWEDGFNLAKEGYGFQKDGKYYDGKAAYNLGYNDNDNLRKLFIPALVIIFVAAIVLTGMNAFRRRD